MPADLKAEMAVGESEIPHRLWTSKACGAAGWLLLACCAACAFTDPVIPAAEGKQVQDVAAAPLALTERIATARAALASGDYGVALQTLDAEAEAGTPPELVRERALLRTEARRHLLQSEVVDAWIQVPDGPVTLGAEARAELVLANISGGAIRIAANGVSGSSACRIEAVCEEFPVDGSSVSHSITTTVTIDRELPLEPGQRAAFPFTLATMEVSPQSPTVRIYTIRATLHTGALESGGQKHLAALAFRAGRMVVLPRNWEQLATDPLTSLKNALQRGAGYHLVVAAALLQPEQGGLGRDLLATALAERSTSPGLIPALKAALAVCDRLAERVGSRRAAPPTP